MLICTIFFALLKATNTGLIAGWTLGPFLSSSPPFPRILAFEDLDLLAGLVTGSPSSFRFRSDDSIVVSLITRAQNGAMQHFAAIVCVKNYHMMFATNSA